LEKEKTPEKSGAIGLVSVKAEQSFPHELACYGGHQSFRNPNLELDAQIVLNVENDYPAVFFKAG
jgi:hypothetical protein